MKQLLVLSAIVAMTACQSEQTPKKPIVTGGDSPIIVSDSSPTTHVKHKGAGADFLMSNNGTNIVATVADNLLFNTFDCPQGSGFTSCSPITLVAPWTLTAFDDETSLVFTMTSADNMTVITKYNSTIADVDSKIDTTTDTNRGTDLNQKDHQLQSVTLLNKNNTISTSLTCPTSPCKVRISFK